jgi:eukaryotic-like serine/threonine-protein kinase
MSKPTIPDDDREQRLEQAMAEYIQAEDAGQVPEPQAFLARYSDLRPELDEFLAYRSELAWLVDPLAPRAPRKPDVVRPPELAAAQGSTQSNVTIEDAPAAVNFQEVPLVNGTRVRYFGDYELINKLGWGGMGVVYKARQIRLNRPVALKLLKSDTLAGDDDRRRFQNEAEAVAVLDHSHIVPIFEVGEYEGRQYFSMKLIGGPSLEKKLSAYASDPKAAAKLVKTAAEAVHHAHQRGILHRDLKPSNILLDERGDPYVTDFGLAKRVEGDSEMTVSGAILGTPAYMAPEQASGRRGAVTTATDVYGLGAILYALVTGRAPFRGDSLPEILEQVRERPPEPPSKMSQRTPRDLEIICLKCLEKDPRRRYASAQALAEDLGRYVAGEPIAARPVGPIERAWLWCQRRPVVASLAALLVTALVTGTTVSTFFALRATEKANEALDNARKATGEAQAARAARERSDRLRYIADINLAHRDVQAGNLQSAYQRLQDLIPRGPGDPDFRYFEWEYLQALCHRELWTVEGGPAGPALFSPDWRRLAKGGSDGTLRVWGAVTRRQLLSLPGDPCRIEWIAFSPDGSRLASVSNGRAQYKKAEFNTVRVWDAATGLQLLALTVNDRWICSATFSPDGRHLAAVGSDSVRVWDAATGHKLLTLGDRFVKGALYSAAFSPDGRRLATAVGQTVRVWDVLTWHEVLALRGPTDQVSLMVFSPDGRQLATKGYRPTGQKAVRVWDASTGLQLLSPPEVLGETMCLTFSPDGRQLAIAASDGVRVWDAGAGREVFAFRKGEGWFRSAAFSPDGRRLATADYQTLRVWDLPTGRELVALPGYSGLMSWVAMSPDGSRLAAVDGETVRVWHSEPEPELLTLRVDEPWDKTVAFSPDGRRLASIDRGNTVRIWDTMTGFLYLALESRGKVVDSVAFNPDGRRLAVARTDAVQIWDASAGVQQLSLATKGRAAISTMTFSPDGRYLAAAGRDAMMRVWDTSTGREFQSFPGYTGRTDWLAFSPDGRRLAAVGTNSEPSAWGVRVWDTATGRELLTLPSSEGWIRSVAFSPDGHRLASAGWDSMVRVRDAATGRELLTLRGHRGWVNSVVFSPDGHRLASAGSDMMVRVWDAATGRELLALPGHDGEVKLVAFSSDGRRLASAGVNGKVRTWDATSRSSEARVLREALGLVRFLLPRISSEVELRDRIEHDQTISDPVRSKAKELAGPIWQTHLRQIHERYAPTVKSLFDHLLLRSRVLEAIRADSAIDPKLRTFVLELARSHPERGPDLNDVSWKIVVQRGL